MRSTAFQASDDDAERVEIHENLIRTELEPADLGIIMERRDALLDDLGLRAKVGMNQFTGGGAVAAPPLKATD